MLFPKKRLNVFNMCFQVKSRWVLPSGAGGFCPDESAGCTGKPVWTTGFAQRLWKQQHRNSGPLKQKFSMFYVDISQSVLMVNKVNLGNKFPSVWCLDRESLSVCTACLHVPGCTARNLLMLLTPNTSKPSIWIVWSCNVDLWVEVSDISLFYFLSELSV